MTLIELIVSLTITGLIISAGYAALSSVVDHRARAKEVTEASMRAANIRRTLVSWMAGARLTVDEDGPHFLGLDGISEHWRDDEISFLTTSVTPAGPGEASVRLFIDRDERTPQKGLTAVLEQWRGAGRVVIELEPAATGLEMRYFSRILGETGWLPSWISGTILPAGMEMTLAAAEGSTLEPLLTLPIRVNLEAGR